MIKPDPALRQLFLDIDRSKVRVWALTNAYRTVRVPPSPRPRAPYCASNVSHGGECSTRSASFAYCTSRT